MSDESRDYVKLLQDNYGWVGAACAFLSLAFKWTRKKVTAAWVILTRTQTSMAIDKLTAVISDLSLKTQVATAVSRIALNETQVARWETDEHGQCVWINEAACRLFGLSEAEMLGIRWTQAIDPGHAGRVMQGFRAAYESTDYVYSQPYVIVVRGQRIPVISRAVEVVRKPDGKIHTMFGTIIPELHSAPACVSV